jgi:hypothetical protein
MQNISSNSSTPTTFPPTSDLNRIHRRSAASEIADTWGKIEILALVFFTLILVVRCLAATNVGQRIKAKCLTAWNEGKQSLLRRLLSQAIDSQLLVWQACYNKFIEDNRNPPSRTQLAIGYHNIRRTCTDTALPAAKKCINELFQKHAIKGSIVELGSNILEEGQSYLTKLLDDKYLTDLTFSDDSKETVRLESLKTRKKYIYLDATTMEETLPVASCSNIVGINVLDTIPRDKLQDVVNGAYKALKDNGKMVVLADLLFDQEPLLKKYFAEDNLIFPYRDKNNLGIKIISKENLMKEVQKLDPQFIELMNSIFNLSSDARSKLMFLMEGYKTGLCDILSELCKPECYQKIEQKESFTTDLTEAFASHKGFRILENGYVESEILREGTIRHFPPINIIGNDLRTKGFKLEEYSLRVPMGQCMIKSVFHILIAKKLPSSI